jgi:hypothetical protein
MALFNSYMALEDAVMNKLQEGLNGKAKKEIEKRLIQNINSSVYSVYKPSRYRRRYELVNKNNIVNISNDRNRLCVTSIAKPNKSIISTIDVASYINHQDSLIRWIEGYEQPDNSALSSIGIYWYRYRGFDPSKSRFMRKRRPVMKTQRELETGDLRNKIIQALAKKVNK